MKILVEIDTADKEFGELVAKNPIFAPFLFSRMTTPTVTEEAPKKKSKRGRPKKLAAVGENGEKRKRGRPKKVVDNGATASPATPASSPAA